MTKETVDSTVPTMTEETGMDPYLIAQAQEAAEREKNMTIKEALPTFWRGMLWSCALSFALVMEGYDVSLTGSYYGQPYFQKKFGHLNSVGKYEIAANWQAGIGNIGNVGSVIGLLLNGYCQYHYGAKKTYCVSMIAMAAFIFIFVFAPSLPVLMVGQFLIGIPWGVFQTLTTAYAAEICPMAARAYLTSFVNICWAAGLFIGSGVVRGALTIESDMSWRLPYILQWVWVLPLFLVGFFAPESPWYLARMNRFDDAKRSIARTAKPGFYQDHDLEAQVALMRHTLELERQQQNKYSIWNCFKGTNLRRVEIACVVWAVQTTCGQQLTGYTAQFLQVVGMDVDKSFDIGLGQSGCLVFGTILVWFGINRFGRRPIYIWGQIGVLLCQLLIGVFGFFNAKTPGLNYGIATFLMLLNLVFACTLGPTCYTIVAEIPAAEVRGPTIVLARAAYVIIGMAFGQINPRMITVDGWNWGARGALLYVGLGAIAITWTYFRLPETRDRTYGELDILFHNKVSARKFSTTKVDEFEGDEIANYGANDKDLAEVEHKD